MKQFKFEIGDLVELDLSIEHLGENLIEHYGNKVGVVISRHWHQFYLLQRIEARYKILFHEKPSTFSEFLLRPVKK